VRYILFNLASFELIPVKLGRQLLC